MVFWYCCCQHPSTKTVIPPMFFSKIKFQWLKLHIYHSKAITLHGQKIRVMCPEICLKVILKGFPTLFIIPSSVGVHSRNSGP